jgi:hypothetical protein
MLVVEERTRAADAGLREPCLIIAKMGAITTQSNDASANYTKKGHAFAERKTRE